MATSSAVRFVLARDGRTRSARTGNLLTGQLYIALEFLTNAPKVDFDVNAKPLMMPTVGGSLDKLQEQLASIVGKMQNIPFDSIGRHLDGDLAELNKTLKQVNSELLPETNRTLRDAQRTFGTASSTLGEDSPLQQNLAQVLQELQRTAGSMRALTELLGRHPEALIRGRPTDPVPAVAP